MKLIVWREENESNNKEVNDKRFLVMEKMIFFFYDNSPNQIKFNVLIFSSV